MDALHVPSFFVVLSFSCYKILEASFGQLRPLPLFQVDMGVKFLALHLLDDIGQPIGLGVQIGMVNLENIPGEDDLCPPPPLG